MTKYYFIGYMYRKGYVSGFSHCTAKIVDQSLDGIINSIKALKSFDDVVIVSMKDLTKKEYKMLKGGSK